MDAAITIAVGVILAAVILALLVAVIDAALDLAEARRRAVQQRSLVAQMARRAEACEPLILPLSLALDRRPRLGARVWLRHDAIDEARGGLPCRVALVDRAGVVHDVDPLDPRIVQTEEPNAR